MTAKDTVEKLLAQADVRINGKRAWDIQVHNERFYSRVLTQGALGLGESYMDGWWDVKKLDEFFFRVLRARLEKHVRFNLHTIHAVAKSVLLNTASRSRSPKVAKEHYDLGNDFYKHMLDKHMQYTCAYWKAAKTLDKAQEQKLDLVCKKLKLKKGERVLELGGGWGGFAYYAAKNYGVHVTSYNISAEQVAYARKRCKGLPVEIVQSDYRDATGVFDKVVSIGMCEHVGYKNYRRFMLQASRHLKDDGIFLLHTIGGNKSVTSTNPWTEKYIFPGGMLPSINQLGYAMENVFVMEDWHNFGPDYDKTLMAWHANFEKNWHKHQAQYGQRFYRMWRYYLLSCAGGFRARTMQLWQVVLTKQGGVLRYEPVR